MTTPLSETLLHVSPPPTMIFGVGTIQQLPEQIRALGKNGAFIVTDKGLVEAGVIDNITAVLKKAGISYTVFDDVDSNPTTTNIANGSAELQKLENVALVSVGGGSPMDAAKGMVLHHTNGGDVVNLDLSNTDINDATVPIIAIPTTAGTGSETNAYGVISNPDTHRKFYVGGPSAQAKITILDPEITVSVPKGITAGTGMDVMSHALEVIVANWVNPYGEALALEGIRIVHEWLPKAVEDGTNIEARSQMLWASHTVMVGHRTGTGMGLIHALGHSIGARMNSPHGLTLAIIMPDIMTFNLPAGASKYARAAFAMGVGDTSKSDHDNALSAIEAVRNLSERVGTAITLTDLGCTADIADTLAVDTLVDGALLGNPIQPTHDQIKELVLANL